MRASRRARHADSLTRSSVGVCRRTQLTPNMPRQQHEVSRHPPSLVIAALHGRARRRSARRCRRARADAHRADSVGRTG